MVSIRHALSLLPALGLALVVSGCQGGSETDAAAAPGSQTLSGAAEVGRKLFNDASLSGSGRVACASCHIPSKAHADNQVVPFGGQDVETAGFRNAPSLRYLVRTPAFFFDAEGTPTGGLNRDGRGGSFADQSSRPFLTAHEMGNVDAAAVTEKLKKAAYAAEFRQVFGPDVFNDPETAFARARFALQRYQVEEPGFASYSSKYDEFLRGRASLSAAELRGLALFNDPAKGNCAACHPSGRSADGSLPLFTDFTYDNLGVPRNTAIPANKDPDYYDLGLCGPERTDLADRGDLCGAFKVPSLRNVALTAPYFHNGKFATLKDAIRFYVRRDTNPEEWYPKDAGGNVVKFDDLPARYRANVNTSEVPYDRHPGEPPRLSETEIDDMVTFLDTLTDGYVK